MADGLFLYYITDRTQFPGDEAERRRALLARISETARCGVDYIQLREKDLSTRELEMLANEAVRVVREQRTTNSERPTTRLLVNSRSDVALAAGADGVHLRSDDISPSDVRHTWSSVAARVSQPAARNPIIAVSCHTRPEIMRAASDGADFAVFAPVFEKRVSSFELRDSSPPVQPAGLAALAEVCKAGIPVLALGGVTLANAASCIEAGAAGIAGIRLFQDNDLSAVIPALRRIRT